MESRNPVFSRSEEFNRKGGGGYATFDTRTPDAGELNEMYGSPSATATQMGRMTIDDVVMKTAMIFGVLLVAAGLTFAMDPPAGLGLVIGSALVGFALSLAISFSKTIRPPLILVYAAVEGVFVGGISDWYGTIYGDAIIPQAVLGTLAAFSAMLVLYKIGAVRNSPKFQRILIIAAVGYLVFGLVNILGSAFGAWESVYSGGGLLPIAISAFGVVLASLFLVLDFDFIEQGIRNGVPEKFAWIAAFGLVVTLVWLYLEILRLLAILRGDN
jgi:uncharacterized YccA/Bax inhibitor family protein